MATTSNRSIELSFAGQVNWGQTFPCAPHTQSSADSRLIDLDSGDNVILIPVGAVAITIIPPSDNDKEIFLKGDPGDVGIQLNMVDPTSVGLGAVLPIILNAEDDITGVRIIFS